MGECWIVKCIQVFRLFIAYADAVAGNIAIADDCQCLTMDISITWGLTYKYTVEQEGLIRQTQVYCQIDCFEVKHGCCAFGKAMRAVETSALAWDESTPGVPEKRFDGQPLYLFLQVDGAVKVILLRFGLQLLCRQ